MDLSNKPHFTADRESELAWIAYCREEMAAFMLRAMGAAAQPLLEGISSARDLAQLKREAQRCAWILAKKAEPGHIEAFRSKFALAMA
jgi:hypothetical protein